MRIFTKADMDRQRKAVEALLALRGLLLRAVVAAGAIRTIGRGQPAFGGVDAGFDDRLEDLARRTLPEVFHDLGVRFRVGVSTVVDHLVDSMGRKTPTTQAGDRTAI